MHEISKRPVTLHLMDHALQAQEQEELQEQEAALAARAAAIQGLAKMVADPQDLWQAAVQLARTYTSAAGANIQLLSSVQQGVLGHCWQHVS